MEVSPDSDCRLVDATTQCWEHREQSGFLSLFDASIRISSHHFAGSSSRFCTVSWSLIFFRDPTVNSQRGAGFQCPGARELHMTFTFRPYELLVDGRLWIEPWRDGPGTPKTWTEDFEDSGEPPICAYIYNYMYMIVYVYVYIVATVCECASIYIYIIILYINIYQ